jgi:hypothetical protein
MATIPTFEELLLEAHQSLGLKFEQKDKKKLPRLEKPLAGHLAGVEQILNEIFSTLGMDALAQRDATLNVSEWANFDKSVELGTWTFAADRSQILWQMLGYSYAPAMGRRLAFWTLHKRLDMGMPAGQFWYLPRASSQGPDGRLVMPVAQVVEWLRDLLGVPMRDLRLGGQAAQARQQQIDDAKQDPDVYASMVRELQNWRQGTLPQASTIAKYFPDDAALTFKGTLELAPDMPLREQLQAAVEFVRAKNLDATRLRDQISMTQPGRLEAILADQAPDDEARQFVDLVKERWSVPSMETVRRRLLIARMVQDGYRRLGQFLLGDDFDEGCADPARNKLLQLIALFQRAYEMTLLAAKESDEPARQNAWFDRQLTPWERDGVFVAIAPSKYLTGAVDLAVRLTRSFESMQPGDRLEDLVGYDEASTTTIVERESRRAAELDAEKRAIRTCIQTLTRGGPYKKLQKETNYTVVSEVAQADELPLNVRQMAGARAEELAASPSEVIGAITLQLYTLFSRAPAERPNDIRMQVERLLVRAEASPAFSEWEAVVLQYKAKHALASNDFASAHKLFNAALAACQVRNYGPMRGEIARDAFAVVVERPPVGFSLGNYEGYLRNMLAFGTAIPTDMVILPSLEDAACEVAEYFWDCLYVPYRGERVESPLAQKDIEAITGVETMELLLHADWDGLDAWMKRNAELRDKRLRHVRGETVLLMWLRALYQARQVQPEILALQAEYPTDQIASMANTFVRALREGVKRLIKAWPKLVNLPNFKKQTPLMLAARHGDAEMAELLLAAGAAPTHQDLQGKTALDLALAADVPACVELLRVHTKMREKKLDELA